MHIAQAIHFSGENNKGGITASDSGFEHHAHLRGHPWKKIIVLIPSPSFRLYFCMLNTFPFKYFVLYDKISCAVLVMIAS